MQLPLPILYTQPKAMAQSRTLILAFLRPKLNPVQEQKIKYNRTAKSTETRLGLRNANINPVTGQSVPITFYNFCFFSRLDHADSRYSIADSRYSIYCTYCPRGPNLKKTVIKCNAVQSPGS